MVRHCVLGNIWILRRITWDLLEMHNYIYGIVDSLRLSSFISCNKVKSWRLPLQSKDHSGNNSIILCPFKITLSTKKTQSYIIRSKKIGLPCEHTSVIVTTWWRQTNLFDVWTSVNSEYMSFTNNLLPRSLLVLIWGVVQDEESMFTKEWGDVVSTAFERSKSPQIKEMKILIIWRKIFL